MMIAMMTHTTARSRAPVVKIALSFFDMNDSMRELSRWYSLSILVSLSGSKIVIAGNYEAFNHKSMRIVLRAFHIHKTA